MSGSAVKVPNVRALEAVKVTAAALAERERTDARLAAQTREIAQKIEHALVARISPVEVEDSQTRLRSAAARLVDGKSEFAAVAAERDEAERRRDLAALRRDRDLAAEATRQSAVLRGREEDAFSEAACAAMRPQYVELVHEALLKLIAASVALGLVEDFRDGLVRQGVNLFYLPDLRAPLLGDVRNGAVGFLPELLSEAISLRVLDVSDLPAGSDGFIAAKGLEDRREREAVRRPGRKVA